MMNLENLIERAVSAHATDLHICENAVPRIRVDTELFPFPGASPINMDEAISHIFDNLSKAESDIARKKFEEGKDIDCAFSVHSGSRIRANIYYTEAGKAAALRIIPYKRMTAEEIGIPFSAIEICREKSGLFIVTGANGSGKTSTLAAMIDVINASRKVHILTIEDPIEYQIKSSVALVSQREVGIHAPSFYSALRSAVRENPDVIMLGEMRDLETTRTAIELAETGHLVLATLHTRNVPSTIDRLISQFPANEQAQTRMMIASNIKGILAQTLLAKRSGGLIASFELLISTPAVSNIIREAKIPQLVSAMQTGHQYGMITMEESLLRLVERNVVSAKEALSKSPDPQRLIQYMKESDKIPIETMRDILK